MATRNTPDFFIIGAQKSGTTWLWNMLNQHPGTSLPKNKEIHYFGSSEIYAKGDDWYFDQFRHLDADKITGEASTSYFYDNVPYWFNDSDKIEFDPSLPPIPELISRSMPEAKFVVILRDPVRRAISAYSHWMKKGELSPLLGLQKIATEQPKLRIIEYGYYAKYLSAWQKVVPADRLRILIFEDQIRKNWDSTLTDTYRFLGLDATFKPELPNNPIHRSWGWTRVVFSYYTSKVFKSSSNSRLAMLLDRFDILSSHAIKKKDIDFLRSLYLPERDELARITGNPLTCWDYGSGLLLQP